MGYELLVLVWWVFWVFLVREKVGVLVSVVGFGEEYFCSGLFNLFYGWLFGLFLVLTF